MKKLILLWLIISCIGIISTTELINETFVDGIGEWTIANGSAVNQWFCGPLATPPTGGSTHGMYVTNNTAVTPPPNAYTGGVGADGSKVFIYRELPMIPADAHTIQLKFTWRCNGENEGSLFDFMRVYMQPAGFVPTPEWGTTVTNQDLREPNTVGRDGYRLQTTWATETINLLPSVYAGEIWTLVFAWRNDGSVVNQPPASVTDIIVTYYNAPEPNPVTMLRPINAGTFVSNFTEFAWLADEFGPVATDYQLVVSENADLSVPIIDETIAHPTTVYNVTTALSPLTTYYWSVTPSNSFGSPTDPTIWSFTTSPPGVVMLGNIENHNTTNQHVPMFHNWRYNYTQSIFYPSEINTPAGQQINEIAWHYNGALAYIDVVTIYMGYTHETVFPSTSFFPLSNQLRVANNASIVLTTVPGSWVNVVLDTPFIYDPSRGNLVITVIDQGGGTLLGTTGFYYTTNTPNLQRSNYIRKDGEPPYYPGSIPATGTRVNVIPNTRLVFGALPAGANLSVSHDNFAWGTITCDLVATPQIFTITNTATDSVTISDISIAGTDAEQFWLENAPAPGTVLTSGQSIAVTVKHRPTGATGVRSANITITDDRPGTHTITLSSAALNQTLATADLPHFQNFDTTAVNSLPPAWGRLISANATGAEVRVEAPGTATVLSAPNVLYIWNGSVIASDVIAHTPPITELNTRRIDFHTRIVSAGVTLEVGYLLDNTDPSSFVLVDTISDMPTATWVHSIVPFGGQTIPAGNYPIAFRHGQNLSSSSIRIDNVTISTLPPNPVFTCNVTSINFGLVGTLMPNTSDVRIQNLGLGDLILDFDLPNHIEMVQDNPLTIPSGGFVNVTFELRVPTAMAYTGTIAITTNDPVTPTHNIAVSATVEEIVLIGNGSLTGHHIPIRPWYRYTWSQTIYYWDQVNDARPTGGNISSIKWLYSGGAWTRNNLRVYMALTDRVDFPTNTSWIDVSEFTMVYHGSITSTAGTTTSPVWITIDLDEEFFWAPGMNLVIAVDDGANALGASTDTFFCTPTPGVNRSLVTYNDTNPYNSHLGNPTPSTLLDLRQSFPNIILEMSVETSDTALTVSPSTLNFGDIYLGFPVSPRSVMIMNLSDEPVQVTAIDITGDDADEFAIVSPPVLPLTIQPGIANRVMLSITHDPTSGGEKEATLTIVDDSDGVVTHTVDIISNVTDHTITQAQIPHMQNFDAVTVPALPAGWRVINTTGASTSAVRTSTSGTPYSLPNHLELYNGNTVGVLGAHTPPIENLSTKRIRFWTRTTSSAATHTVRVGTMSDPTNPSTFNLIATIPLTNVNAMHFVSMASADTTDKYIVFAHGMTASFITIYVDDVYIENAPAGADFFTLTTALNYGLINIGDDSTLSASFTNHGVEDMTMNFSLPPYMELDQVNPVTVLPGQTLSVGFILNIPYFENYTGTINIATNASNMPTYAIPVTANAAQILVVGTGATLEPLPWNTIWRFTYSQTIYHQSELVGLESGSLISTLGWHHNGAVAGTRPVRVYLGYTTETAFSGTSAWISINDLDMVYDGNYSLPGVAGWRHITLIGDGWEYAPPSPNHNLVVVMEVWENVTFPGTSNFFATTTTDNRSIRYISDSAPANLTSPQTGTLRQLMPNLTIGFEIPGLPRPRQLSGTAGFNRNTLTWLAPNIPGAAEINSMPATHKPASDRGNFSRSSATIEDVTLSSAPTFLSYTLYRDGTPLISGLEHPIYVDNEVVNGISYTYFVKAIYTEGESNPSNSYTLTPFGPDLAPPANLTVNLTGESATLNWQLGDLVINESFEIPLGTDWSNVNQNGDPHLWEISTFGGKEGNQYAFSRSRDAENNLIEPNNWLITPQINVPVANTYLNFWVGALSTTNFLETYKLMVSPTGSINPADFVELLPATTLDTGAWKRVSINLSAFAHATNQIRIAFVHIPTPEKTQRSYIRIDGVQIVAPGASSPSPIGFRVYRNETVVHAQVTSLTSSLNQLPLGQHEIWVTALYNIDDQIVESSPSNAHTILIVSEYDETEPIMATRLRGNYPNPFNPETTIAFDLARQSHVNIDIYNVKGQRVRTLTSDMFSVGSHKVLWNGKDDAGREVASGIYFTRMQTDHYQSVNKMILMK